jgi:hypothetical protein
VIGEAEFIAVNATLGMSIPLFADFTSSMAEGSGEEPSIVTETWAVSVVAQKRAKIKSWVFIGGWYWLLGIS